MMWDESDDSPPRPDEVPPTDASGDVDLGLIADCLSLTPAQRIERHYQARLLAECLRRAGEQLYGSAHPDPEAA
jgi:hypothetical protein